MFLQAPELSGLPSFMSLPEETDHELVLANISISDPDNSTWTEKYPLSIDSTNPGVSLKYDSQDCE